jgi:uncharacterized protein YbjT (DUF2867 family)
MATTLITGGTGGTGRALTALLAETDARVRVASRHRPSDLDAEHVSLDWEDPATYAAALKDVDRLYLLPPTFARDFHALLTPFLAAAKEAGVRRIVVLGASQAPPQQLAIRAKLHEAVAEAVPEWAILRPTWFMQNFIDGHPYFAGLHENGEIVTATGSGRIGFVDVRDIAAVAAHLLLADRAGETDYLLTGPQTHDYDEVAAMMTAASGRSIRHVKLSPQERYDRAIAAGLPEAYASGGVAVDAMVSGGSDDVVSDVVAELTGRPARTLQAFIQEYGHVWKESGN